MIKTTFKIKKDIEKKDYSRFIFEPLEQGYGQTLGNSLRRCLLNNIPGAAVVRVKIEGIRHQFSTLSGMKEDIVEFILNLKQLRVIYKGDEEAKITLSTKGTGPVTAKDLKLPANVKIVNSDLFLAKITDKKSSLNVTAWIKSGFGYSPAEERKTTVIGEIPVDASFSPITRVNYKVEATRVGRRTDLDRLIMEIWTNGTIKSKDALDYAAKTLVGFFKQVYDPAKEEEVKIEDKSNENTEVFKLTVEELNLPTRIANSLRKGGYPTVGDLSKASKSEIAKVKNLGAKSVTIIMEKLQAKGVSLKQ